MRILLVIGFILTQVTSETFAQKRPLDYAVSSEWPIIRSPTISPDGSFAIYTVVTHKTGNNLIVQAIDGTWKKEIPGSFRGIFTQDGRHVILQNEGDSLYILDLATKSMSVISQVSSFKVPEAGDGRWIAYQQKGTGMTVVLLNLITGKENRFVNIEEYLFDKKGRSFIFKQVTVKDSIPPTTVLITDLKTEMTRTICQTYKASHFVFDVAGEKLVFLTERPVGMKGQNTITLNYYTSDMDNARPVLDHSVTGMDGMKISENDISFSENGDRIFFYVEKPYKVAGDGPPAPHAQVNIQGIADEELKAAIDRQSPTLAMFNLRSVATGVIKLQQEADNNRTFYTDHKKDWLVCESNIVGNYNNEYNWRMSAIPDLYLISMRYGTRILLKERVVYQDLSFSRTGKYVIWFDRQKRNWFSHNITTNKTRDITCNIGSPFYTEDDHPDAAFDEGLGGWLENDKGVLIYDRHDIWQVDPDGIKAPVNLTQGYGAKNNIRFRCMDFDPEHPKPIHSDDTLILSAFNQNNKYGGFFSLVPANRMLKQLVQSPDCYIFEEPTFNGVHYAGPIVKAKYVNVYLLSRMSATEYPNLYTTTDFREFRPVTDLSPQKAFNWYTTELIRWRQLDGIQGQGILYKPEDFDPHKKYPIIFFYYERNAFALYTFIHPELTTGALNIPWFVSNGYLVFVPDIRFKKGYPGRSAYNSVVSAALYFSKKPWIDSHRMGIQGHSFGGFETNYIVSHTSLFAAAAPASAVSDMISAFAEFDYEISFHEKGQGRMGTTLWKRPDLYIENSPVFKVDKVSTPLLIMHTVHDGVVSYAQAYQWYNELHRLGKPVWLLSYEGGNHILSNEKEQLDYSIRLGQFFNHYLKGTPAPKWMTQGSLPGKSDDGLELDLSGRQP